MSEQLYDAIIVWNAAGSLNVTSISQPFFALFQSDIAVGTYDSSSSTFTSLISSVKSFADGFVAVVAKYTPSNGGLSEQYLKSDGTQTSASDLTWSYAATLTSFQARDGFKAAGWGAAGLTVPATCSTGGGSSPGSGSSVAVTFNVQATTVFGGKLKYFEFDFLLSSPNLWDTILVYFSIGFSLVFSFNSNFLPFPYIFYLVLTKILLTSIRKHLRHRIYRRTC